ncbi:MAG: 3-deoxy-manno-octulosonate cytidylyltransferase [Alkaliphilus sp.]|nr:MAG: 3-deoxy-manno-octulosonate cytidylyltransferase [Alkaliphilus sp.]
MRIGFVIPARLKSTRLKKKILLKLGEQTALEWVIDRAKASKNIDEVVVATTSLVSDSPISKICQHKGVRYFQGHPDDVLLRLKDTAKYFEFDYIVNITPDNTLFSIYLIELIVSEIKEDTSLDFLKFKNPMLGTGIYALKMEALETICEFKNIIDTEIWGHLLDNRLFNVKELEIPKFLRGKYRLTMDTELDYILISKIYSDLGITKKNLLDLNEIIRYLDDNQQIAEINKNVSQKPVSQEILKKISSNFENNKSSFEKIKAKYYRRPASKSQ